MGDANWGIGIDMGDTRVNDPCQWRGANMLGWALMCARSNLAETIDPAVVSQAPADSEAAQSSSAEPRNGNLQAAVADVPLAVKSTARVEDDSTECTEDALASSGIEPANAASEVQGSAAGSKSRKWRRRKDDDA